LLVLRQGAAAEEGALVVVPAGSPHYRPWSPALSRWRHKRRLDALIYTQLGLNYRVQPAQEAAVGA
jgi:hypothetical protein